MPSKQGALTVVAPIIAERKAGLLELLNEIAADGISSNGIFPFHAIPTIHFSRWYVIDDRREHWRGPLDYPERPVVLVFSSNFDGRLDDHLSDLFDFAGAGLNRILAHCEGYPSPGIRTREQVIAYLKRHSVKASGFYRGTPGRTVVQVLYEADLRDRIERFVDDNRERIAGMDPLGARDFIRSGFESDLERPAPGKTRLSLLAKGLIAVGVLLYAVPRTLLLLSVRGLERKSDRAERQRRIPELTARQLHAKHQWHSELARIEVPEVQNQMSLLVPVKPGRRRRWILATVLHVVDRLARLIYDRGRLGGITSIHFARWVTIGNGRFLLFMSNYDQSWEDYLGEFIDRASVGLSAIWSNTMGFPQTRWLIHDGARHAAEFKTWARSRQLVTQVWYSAYPHLSVRNVNANTKVRAGLYGKMTQAEAREWLNLL